MMREGQNYPHVLLISPITTDQMAIFDTLTGRFGVFAFDWYHESENALKFVRRMIVK